ncbi:MAG: winged helix-turn-helix transcriptional regulator, partial [Lachnospiraceae bacterium]|nr:winged helix-turn-helix transcriptional regulator [Lachnospiraceae bacterium]
IKAEDTLQYADLCFNKSNRELTCIPKTIFLTAKESELLYVFMKSPETLFSREQLILKIWGTSSEVEQGNVDNYISFLRKRLRE